MSNVKPMIGLIMVREGLITRDQLQKALLRQGHLRRLGRIFTIAQVLQEMGLVTTVQVEMAVEIQDMLTGRDAPPALLGQLVVESGLVAPSVVSGALIETEETGSPLGEVLIRRGQLTIEQLHLLLSQQAERRGISPPGLEELRSSFEGKGISPAAGAQAEPTTLELLEDEGPSPVAPPVSTPRPRPSIKQTARVVLSDGFEVMDFGWHEGMEEAAPAPVMAPAGVVTPYDRTVLVSYDLEAAPPSPSDRARTAPLEAVEAAPAEQGAIGRLARGISGIFKRDKGPDPDRPKKRTP